MARKLGSLFKLAQNKDIPIEESFFYDLTKHIETYDPERDDDRNKKPSKTYSPSSMKCIRNMYYKVTGAETETNDGYSLIGINESGSARHEMIQRYIYTMKKRGFDCEYVDVGSFILSRGLTDIIVKQQADPEKGIFETKLYNKKYNFSFLCDGIIRYKGQYLLLEIKTEVSFKFQGRKGVDPGHLDQASAYSCMLGLDKVLFLYESRDLCLKKPYLLTVTEQNRIELMAKRDRCQVYVEKGVVPPKPDCDRKVCQYCPYPRRCSEDK